MPIAPADITALLEATTEASKQADLAQASAQKGMDGIVDTLGALVASQRALIRVSIQVIQLVAKEQATGGENGAT